MNDIERAHQLYRDGKYTDALNYYTDALSVAKTKPQKIALHSNRAACYLKLHDFHKAAEECTSVLELDYKHTGALMLRVQTLVTLKQYQYALFDVNQLIELNPSSEDYRNLRARLKTQLSLATIPEDDAEFEVHIYVDDENSEGELDEKEVEELRSPNDAAPAKDQDEYETVASVTAIVSSQDQGRQHSPHQSSSGWQKIPKPKGHSQLDYSRWDSVADGSSEEANDTDDVDSEPQYRFRVKTVGVRAVK